MKCRKCDREKPSLGAWEVCDECAKVKEKSNPHVEPPTTLDCVPLHLFPNCCITCEWSNLEEEGYSCTSDKMWDDYKAGRCQQINSLIRMSGTDVCKYFEHFEQMGEVGDKDEW